MGVGGEGGRVKVGRGAHFRIEDERLLRPLTEKRRGSINLHKLKQSGAPLPPAVLLLLVPVQALPVTAAMKYESHHRVLRAVSVGQLRRGPQGERLEGLQG